MKWIVERLRFRAPDIRRSASFVRLIAALCAGALAGGMTGCERKEKVPGPMPNAASGTPISATIEDAHLDPSAFSCVLRFRTTEPLRLHPDAVRFVNTQSFVFSGVSGTFRLCYARCLMIDPAPVREEGYILVAPGQDVDIPIRITIGHSDECAFFVVGRAHENPLTQLPSGTYNIVCDTSVPHDLPRDAPNVNARDERIARCRAEGVITVP